MISRAIRPNTAASTSTMIAGQPVETVTNPMMITRLPISGSRPRGTSSSILFRAAGRLRTSIPPPQADLIRRSTAITATITPTATAYSRAASRRYARTSRAKASTHRVASPSVSSRDQRPGRTTDDATDWNAAQMLSTGERGRQRGRPVGQGDGERGQREDGAEQVQTGARGQPGVARQVRSGRASAVAVVLGDVLVLGLLAGAVVLTAILAVLTHVLHGLARHVPHRVDERRGVALGREVAQIVDPDPGTLRAAGPHRASRPTGRPGRPGHHGPRRRPGPPGTRPANASGSDGTAIMANGFCANR